MRKWTFEGFGLEWVAAATIFMCFGRFVEALAGYVLAAIIAAGAIWYRPASQYGELDPNGFIRPEKPARRHL